MATTAQNPRPYTRANVNTDKDQIIERLAPALLAEKLAARGESLILDDRDQSRLVARILADGAGPYVLDEIWYMQECQPDRKLEDIFLCIACVPTIQTSIRAVLLMASTWIGSPERLILRRCSDNDIKFDPNARRARI